MKRRVLLLAPVLAIGALLFLPEPSKHEPSRWTVPLHDDASTDGPEGDP